VNATQNPATALEVCEQIKANNPDQKLFLVADLNQVNGSHNYVVSNWDELKQKIGGQTEEKPDLVAA
jgi:hypothetical protein